MTTRYWVHPNTLMEMKRDGKLIPSINGGYLDQDFRRVEEDGRLPEGEKFASPPFKATFEVRRAVINALPRDFVARIAAGEIDKMQEIADRAAEAVVPGSKFTFVDRNADPLTGGSGTFHFTVHVPAGSDRPAVPLASMQTRLA